MSANLFIDILRSTLQNVTQQEAYQCFVSFLIACTISITAIPVVINIANLLDLKKAKSFRSAHTVETPEFGGIAIYAGLMISNFLWSFTATQNEIYQANLASVGVTILFFLGLKDDILMLDPNKKLFLQVVAATTLIVLGDLRINSLYGMFGIHDIPFFLSLAFTVFVFIALINAINLIDGIDGLAGGIGFIASIVFGGWFVVNHHYTVGCMAFSLAGGLLGFLRFNFSKTSKIFMGDTGSLIVGFLLAFFAVKFISLNAAILGSPNEVFHAPVLAIVLLIVPIFDTLRVFLIRVLNGQSPFKADRNHFHHILLNNGLTHLQTSLLLWTLTVLTVLAYFATRSFLTSTVSCLVLVGMFFFYLAVGSLLKMRAVKRKKELTWGDFWKLRERASIRQSLTKRFIRNL